MPQVYLTIVGKLRDNDSEEEKQVTLSGYASVITFSPGTPPPRPHPQPPEPGVPTFPIAGYPDNPYPSHPIWRPGYPGGSPPPSFPRPPIEGGGGDNEPKFEWKVGWTEETGWVVVAIPQFPHPTPSGGQQ